MRTHPALINRRSNRLTIEQLKNTKINLDEEQINVFLPLYFRLILFLSEIPKNAEEKISRITKTNRSGEEITTSGISNGR